MLPAPHPPQANLRCTIKERVVVWSTRVYMSSIYPSEIPRVLFQWILRGYPGIPVKTPGIIPRRTRCCKYPENAGYRQGYVTLNVQHLCNPTQTHPSTPLAHSNPPVDNCRACENSWRGPFSPSGEHCYRSTAAPTTFLFALAEAPL